MRHSAYLAAAEPGRHRVAAAPAPWSTLVRLIAFLIFLAVSFGVLLAVSLVPAADTGHVVPRSTFVQPSTYGAPGPNGGVLLHA